MKRFAQAAALASALLCGAAAWASGAELVGHKANYDFEVSGLPGAEAIGSMEIAALRLCRGWRLVLAADIRIRGESQGQPVDLRVQTTELTEELFDHTMAGYKTAFAMGHQSEEAEGRLMRQPGGAIVFDLTRNGQKLTLPVNADTLFPLQATQKLLELLESGRSAFAIKTFSPRLHSAVQMEVWDIRRAQAPAGVEDPAGLLAGVPVWDYSAVVTTHQGESSDASGGHAANGLSTALTLKLISGLKLSATLAEVEPLQPKVCE